MSLLVLALALLALFAGTELTVRQALQLAKRLRLSPMFVGLTIVAIGTDLPELVLSIDAGFQRLRGVDTSGLVIGNAIGSCLAQIGFALGVTGLFGYVTLGKRQARSSASMLVGSIALLALVGADGVLTRIDGGILLAVYLIYFATTIRLEQGENPAPSPRRRWVGSGSAPCASRAF